METSTVYSTIEDASRRGDVVRFWREPRYDGLECLSATFRTHRYVPHTHETYAIAAVVDGCEAFNHRGIRHYAPKGSIALVNPDEIHDGEPADEGFAYRTLYPSIELLRAVGEDVFDRPIDGTPCFAHSVVADAALNERLSRLHMALADPTTPLLERDTLLTTFFAELLSRWGGISRPPPSGSEHAGVRRVRSFLDANYAADPGLDDLAAIAGLNRSHLVRVFRKEVGTTPHAYLLDRRCRAARRMLAAGEAPAMVAAACGFFDQSHLNRVFKARMAVTPGAFRG